MFDPGRCSDRLHDRLFREGRRALVCGGFVWGAAMVSEAGAFLLGVRLQHHFQKKKAIRYAVARVAVDRYFPEARKQMDRVTARGYGTSRDERRAWNSTERGAWWQVRSGIERLRFFLHTKSAA